MDTSLEFKVLKASLKYFFIAGFTLSMLACSGGKTFSTKQRADDSSKSPSNPATPDPISSDGILSGGSHAGTQLTSNNELIPSLTQYNSLQSGEFDLTDIVAIWNLNENPSNGASILDSSGNGQNGTFSDGGAGGSHGATGILEGGIEFNGATNLDQVITVPSSAIVDDLRVMTISAWVYPDNDGNGGSGTIVAKCGSTVDVCGTIGGVKNNGWYFGFINSNYRLFFSIRTNTGNVQRQSKNEAFYSNQWNHVVVTWDGSSNGSTGITFYVNGAKFESYAGSSSDLNFPSDAGTPLTIGASPVDGEFDGVIDEVAIWRRVLSSDEIKEIYDKQKKVYRASYESPVIDFGALSFWSNLSIVTDRPTSKPLSPATETSYSTGGFDSSNLRYYLSMNGTIDSLVPTAANAITSQGPVPITGTAVNSDSSMKYVEAKLSQGISFDGSEDHIVLENHASLDITGTQLTLMAWIKTSFACCHADHGRIISKKVNGGNNDVYALAINNSRPNGLEFRINGLNSTGVVVPRGMWTHVAGVYNGVDRRIYINGTLVNTPDAYTLPINSSANPVHIGMREGENRYFAGSMDEVAILDRALSATEIRDIYLRGKNQYKYQVRSCNDEACSGETYKGPGGDADTYYSELSNFSNSPSVYDISHLGSSRYIQYKAILEEPDPVIPAKILSVDIE